MAYLRAFGSYLPPRRVSNREIAPLVGAAPEWILEVTGIEERRYAADEDTVAGIGLLAARDCLEKAGATAADPSSNLPTGNANLTRTALKTIPNRTGASIPILHS